MLVLAFLVLSYLSGSVPYALLIGLSQGVDIRKHGSGNVGATNCGRIVGKKFGIAAFLLDVTKGLVPVLVYGLITSQALETASGAFAWLAVAAAAVIGHMFPVWLKLKGGKGVATSLGVLLGFWPVLTLAGLGAALVWLVLLNTTAYVGLASVVAAISLPVWALLAGLIWQVPMGPLAVLVVISAILAGLVVYRHRSNIQNLRAGTEPRVKWGIRGKREAGLEKNDCKLDPNAD